MAIAKSRVRWIVGLILTVGGLGIGWKLLPHELLLLDHASMVSQTDHWYDGRRFHEGIGIHWLSDEEVLFCRFEGLKHDERVIYKRNIKTGSELKLTGLTKSRNGFEPEVIDHQCVSPDGRWFICSGQGGKCLLAEVNGHRSYFYPSADDGCYRSLLWMADSRRWLEIYEVHGVCHQLLLHDVEHPKSSIAISLYSKWDLYGHLEAVLSPQNAIAIIDPYSECLLDRTSTGSPFPHLATVHFLSLDAKMPTSSRKSLPVPDEASWLECCVSPQGDRVAWQMTTILADNTRSCLHRFLPFVEPRSQRRSALWVCNIDGSNLHEIGYINEPMSADMSAIWIDHPWLPSGKRLCFKYKDKLYTVPAD